MFSILNTKLICSMDHGECSDALFEVTRPIDDILWLNIRRCIYGALIPSRVKTKNKKLFKQSILVECNLNCNFTI
jgi:hypothetical protein